MSDQELKLACLLASYEMDCPHVDMPDLSVGTEEEQVYPDIKEETFKEWLKTEHHGDCIKLPCSCVRCFADVISHQAKWLNERLKLVYKVMVNK